MPATRLPIIGYPLTHGPLEGVLRAGLDEAAYGIAIEPWDYRSPKFDPVAASVARLWCRQMFVVETYEVLGIDDAYDPDNPFD